MSFLPNIPFPSLSAGEQSAELVVPSGQSLELFEVLIDQIGEETWLRFRFEAPQIARASNGLSFADVEADFEALCRLVALPYMHEYDLHGDRIVVSLSSKRVEFGQSDPDATQFIEVFSRSGDTCIWEGL